MENDTQLRLIARVNVLENFVRVMFRLIAKDQYTPDQILQLAESVKQDQERDLPPEVAAYMTGATDNFFNSLAAELRKYQEREG